MNCTEQRPKKKNPSKTTRDAIAISFLVFVLGLMAYFVTKKVQNDSRISVDTRRIADALEKSGDRGY